MIDPGAYELIDFGSGRKLERIGGIILDRPAPAATGTHLNPHLWADAVAIFHRQGAGGVWERRRSLPDCWRFEHLGLVMNLRLTEFGHVGVFVEQAANWSWITKRVTVAATALREATTPRTPRVLNLFGYTGASTLAAALAGAQVVHVDASKSVVSWARKNAEASGLHGAPIRWIVEDAGRFVARECKRGNRYDGILLDPPSYGHGPKGEPWKLSQHLTGLLDGCRNLLSDQPACFLLSCHTPGYGPAELSAMVSELLFGSCGAGVETRNLHLRTANGRRLHSGATAYWP